MKLKNTHPLVILSFLFVFGICALSVLADDTLSSRTAVFQDSDKDGLSDGEEKIYGTDPNKADSDNDGYSDGVEVKSGYDPNKPAPGDKIMPVASSAVLGESASSADADNMTSQLSEKLAAFIKANEGKEGSVSVENLDTIIDEALGDELNQDFSVAIDENLIRVKKQDYAKLSEQERLAKEKEDAIVYFRSILYILANNAPGAITSEEDLSGVLENCATQYEALLEGSDGYNREYFPDLAERGRRVFEELGFVEVPEKLLDLHKEGLNFLLRAVELDKITIDVNDSVGLIVNLSKIQSVIEQGAAFQENFTIKMDEYGIKSGVALITGN